MNDKIVTHADLDAIALIESAVDQHNPGMAARVLVQKLRAAAEADQPPLPDGYAIRTAGVFQYLHFVKGGQVSDCRRTDDELDYPEDPSVYQHSTWEPLRPTITEADVEKAIDAYFEADMSGDITDRGAFRKAFEAAGVEVAR